MAVQRPMVRVVHLTDYTGGHKGKASWIPVSEFDGRLYAVYSEPKQPVVRVSRAESVEVPFEITEQPPVDLFAEAERAEREAEELAEREAKELKRKEGLAKAQAAAKAKRDAAKAAATASHEGPAE